MVLYELEGKMHIRGLNGVNIQLNQVKRINELLNERKELKYIKVEIISSLANLLNDDEMDQLEIRDDFIQTLIQGLKETIDKKETNKRVLHGTKYYITYTIGNTEAFIFSSLWLKRICKISINEELKEKVYKSNIFNLLEVFLKNGNDIEQECCCELICLLAFNEKVKRFLKGNNNIMGPIQRILKETKNEETKRYCQQINELVNGVPLTSTTTSSINSNGHIMISYNHKYKEKCLEINEFLKSNGYSTWMDVKASFSDLYVAMASAVESASVVLICYSLEYKESTNCQYEAIYAANRNKPIIAIKMQENYDYDGWLGLILAGKLYVDYTKKDLNQVDTQNGLIKQIELALKGKNEPNATATPTVTPTPNQ